MSTGGRDAEPTGPGQSPDSSWDAQWDMSYTTSLSIMKWRLTPRTSPKSFRLFQVLSPTPSPLSPWHPTGVGVRHCWSHFAGGETEGLNENLLAQGYKASKRQMQNLPVFPLFCTLHFIITANYLIPLFLTMAYWWQVVSFEMKLYSFHRGKYWDSRRSKQPAHFGKTKAIIHISRFPLQTGFLTQTPNTVTGQKANFLYLLPHSI